MFVHSVFAGADVFVDAIDRGRGVVVYLEHFSDHSVVPSGGQGQFFRKRTAHHNRKCFGRTGLEHLPVDDFYPHRPDETRVHHVEIFKIEKGATVQCGIISIVSGQDRQ